MSSPSATEVREAIDAHLSAAFGQVEQLEGTIREQAESLIRKDEQYRASMNDMVDAKDRTIAELQKKLAESEETIKNMKDSIKAKDQELKCRRHHSHLLTQMCRRRAQLNNLVCLMEDSEYLPCFPEVEQCVIPQMFLTSFQVMTSPMQPEEFSGPVYKEKCDTYVQVPI